MKRILQVVSCLEKGGTEAFIMNNYRNINRSEYAFDFLVFTERVKAYEEEIRRLGGHIYFCGVPDVTKLFRFYRNLRQCLKENGPYDAVHSHVNIANSHVLLAAKCVCGGGIVRISHSHAMPPKSRNLLKRLYNHMEEKILKYSATDFLACSKDAGHCLYGRKFFDRYGRVVHNGIELEPFLHGDIQAVDQLKREFILSDEFVCGNITRFEKTKNPLFTVEVFHEILKRKPHSILLLGGVDGGLLSTVQNRVKELGIEGNVRFIGVRNDIKDCLKLINVYIFPSLFEGFGIAVLEAQAAGVYCIASSGVSKEADMGLGLMEFADLSLGAEEWAERICRRTGNPKPDEQLIQKKFERNGYRIQDTVKILEQIYAQTKG